MTVLIGMFLLGFLIGLSTWAFSLTNHYKHELVVKVYFDHGVADHGKEVSDVQSKLAANPLVKSVTPVSAEAGLAQMRKKNPELFKGSTLPYNPLGPALTVQPKRGEEIALPRIMPHVIRASDIHAWPFGLTALIILGTGLLLGAAGSGLTIRRFLQV